jgi:hypothetical protein
MPAPCVSEMRPRPDGHSDAVFECHGGGNLPRCQLCPESGSYWRRCPHGHVCLVNAGHLLHPPGLTVCDLGVNDDVV